MKFSPIQILFVFSIYLFSIIAHAGTYSGIYNGTFSGNADKGEFAIMVDDNDVLILLAFDKIDDSGLARTNIPVNSDGSFSSLSIDGGADINGTIVAGTSVSGTFFDDGLGDFFGTIRPYTGGFGSTGGYYRGTVQCSGGIGNPSILSVILAADGVAFFYNNDDDDGEDGFLANIRSEDTFSGVTFGGANYSGSLNDTALRLEGTGNNSFCSFVFSANRVTPLPSPPEDLPEDPGQGIGFITPLLFPYLIE